jgi:hypothetical protein
MSHGYAERAFGIARQRERQRVEGPGARCATGKREKEGWGAEWGVQPGKASFGCDLESGEIGCFLQEPLNLYFLGRGRLLGLGSSGARIARKTHLSGALGSLREKKRRKYFRHGRAESGTPKAGEVFRSGWGGQAVGGKELWKQIKFKAFVLMLERVGGERCREGTVVLLARGDLYSESEGVSRSGKRSWLKERC